MSLRRVQAHLIRDQTMLDNLEMRLESPELCCFIKQCIQKTVTSLYGQRLESSQIYSIFVLKYTDDFPNPGTDRDIVDAIDGIDGSVSTPNPQPEEIFSDFMPIDDFFDDPMVVNNSPGQCSSAVNSLPLDSETVGLNSPIDTLDSGSNSGTTSNVSEERVVVEFDPDSDLDSDSDSLRDHLVDHTSLASSEPQTEPEPQSTVSPDNLAGQAIPQAACGSNFDDEDSESDVIFPSTPCLDKLKEDLRKHAEHKPNPPPSPFEVKALSDVEELSLQHYSAWQRSGGTVNTYNLHAAVLENATGTSILSLYKVECLAESITKLYPKNVDMCLKSCIAYTGDYANLQSCPYVLSTTKKECQLPRYKGEGAKRRPAAQYSVLPIKPTIQALYANAESSRLMRHRDKCLQKALHLIATAGDKLEKARTYSDFGDSYVHVEIHHKTMGLFKDPRDTAFVLSTDGAQLTMKKHSNTWILILILFNLPPDLRYKSKNVIINFATPGPNSPGDIESFMRPLFEELAQAAEGMWIWDALDSSYFFHHGYLVLGLGDMLGSAKINGMAGHSVIFGDRFSHVQAAKASNTKGAKAQYYPMLNPTADNLNPDWEHYSFDNLPMREHSNYFEILHRIETAANENRRKAITKTTGVVQLPLCAASPAFYHPTFFPIDPFHLIYENCMAFLWDLWTTETSPSEVAYLSITKASLLGSLLASAMPTLPPAFCGPIRNVHLKRQSQYKIFEWMALLHWYIVPIGLEIGMNMLVLENFSIFSRAMEYAMTIAERNMEDLQKLRGMIVEFLVGFERLYIGNNPNLNSRARLCIFQLIHIPIHIYWNGSLRNSSQSTVERSIGEMSRQIRSKKSPFSNLANLIIKRERIKLLSSYYPNLSLESETHIAFRDSGNRRPFKCFQKLPFNKAHFGETGSNHNSPVFSELVVVYKDIMSFLENPPRFEFGDIQRWGKVRISNGRVLQSEIGYVESNPARKSCWFSVRLVFPPRYVGLTAHYLGLF